MVISLSKSPWHKLKACLTHDLLWVCDETNGCLIPITRPFNCHAGAHSFEEGQGSTGGTSLVCRVRYAEFSSFNTGCFCSKSGALVVHQDRNARQEHFLARGPRVRDGHRLLQDKSCSGGETYQNPFSTMSTYQGSLCSAWPIVVACLCLWAFSGLLFID